MFVKYAGIGSRQTPKEICAVFNNIGRELANRGYILCSGHADGADKAFELGCDKVPFSKKEIYLPWRDFNGSDSGLYALPEEAYILAKQFHPRFNELNPTSQKLIARDGMQVLGLDLKTKVDFIVCYTDEGKSKGGTGQALRIAKAYNIPVYNFGDPSGNDQERFYNKIMSKELCWA